MTDGTIVGAGDGDVNAGGDVIAGGTIDLAGKSRPDDDCRRNFGAEISDGATVPGNRAW